jgi:Protein of unknown function (DUF559)
MSGSHSHVDPDIWGRRATRPVDEVVARIATRQGGVVGRRQLLVQGISAKAIDHRVGVGRLRVLHRGVYAVGHEALADRGHLFAGLLVAGAGAALSHRTAAGLWKLIPSMPPFVEITTPGRTPRPRGGLLFHTAKTIDAYTRDGLPVTTPIRTLVDLAATRPRAEVERACSEALVLRLVAPEALATTRGPGSAVLARIVGAGVAPTRSELERRFLRALSRSGVPRPLVDTRVGPYTVDFLWPAGNLVVGVDGARYHGHHLAVTRDHARDAELQLRGYVVLRFTWQDVVRDPAGVLARITRLLARPATRRAS